MTGRMTAVVEGGLLRPAEPLGLPEGTEVEFIIPSVPSGNGTVPGESPDDTVARAKAQMKELARLAALPLEGDGEPFSSGRDHDSVLYGNPKD